MPAKTFWTRDQAMGIVNEILPVFGRNPFNDMVGIVDRVEVCGDVRLMPDSDTIKYISIVAILRKGVDYLLPRAQIKANVCGIWPGSMIRTYKAYDFTTIPDGSGSISWIVSDHNVAGASIVYATGTQIFNEMLALYIESRGMYYSSYGVKLNGEVLDTPTEESFFDLIGLSYIPPDKRPLVSSLG